MLGMDKQVTIWCRWRNPATNKDEWYRHVIDNCSWSSQIVTTATATGAVVASAYSVMIQENPNYLDKRTWDAPDSADRAQYFTLAPGWLMALGDVPFVITGTAPGTEAKAKELLAPDIFTIKAVGDNTEPHKSGRHYRIEGV